MKNGRAPTHIMRWGVQDWLSSPLRGQLALERDHLSRMVYLELLQKLHENGGGLPRHDVAGALLISEEDADRAVERLLRSGRIVEVDGMLSNPRVTADLEREETYRTQQSEFGAIGGRLAGKGRPKAQGAETGVPQGSVRSTPNPPAPAPAPTPMERNCGADAPAPSGPPSKRAKRNGTDARKRTPRSGGSRPPSWSSEACDDWNERFGEGSAHGGRIGSELKGLIGKNGWDVVRPAWQHYLRESTHPAPNPADFRSHFRDWLPGGRGPSRRAGAAEVTARNRSVADQWEQDVMEGRR